MTYTIAITGKGGVGKTTIAGLLVLRLIARGCRPVLAVDADPNSCLAGVLGVCSDKSIGAVREEARIIAGKGMAAGISKQDLLEMKISESLVEAEDFDLMAMGRPEGPGCYCYANNVLKSAITQIADNYPFLVIDNEAGLENLSRRIVRKVDLLVLATDPSRRGLTTARRIHDLAHEMGIEYKSLALVVNRVRRGAELSPDAADLAGTIAAKTRVVLPESEPLADLAENGAPLTSLPANHGIWQTVDRLLTGVAGPVIPEKPPEPCELATRNP